MLPAPADLARDRSHIDVDDVFDKDSPGKISFTPEKPGTYKFKCAKFCGLGHGKMKGEIVVAP